MDQKQLFIGFWKHEALGTRKVISRVPEGEAGYRPHEKSRSAKELAWLIVLEEKLLIEGLESGTIDWREEDVPATVAEIVAIYDAQHAATVARLEQLNAAKWEAEVGFEVGGTEYRRGTGFDYAWEFLFDQIHHRGQLSTYLRPMGAKVPAIIGPSADEME